MPYAPVSLSFRSWWLPSTIVTLCLSFFLAPLPAQAKKAKKKNAFTKQERNLTRLPRVKLYDRRIRRVYRLLSRRYKHLYASRAGDGYIFPNELRDLKFERRIAHRLWLIDNRNHKVTKRMRRIRRKRRRSKAYQEEAKALSSRKAYYEKMIRRFACRYLDSYKKKKPDHCKRRKS